MSAEDDFEVVAGEDVDVDMWDVDGADSDEEKQEYIQSELLRWLCIRD